MDEQYRKASEGLRNLTRPDQLKNAALQAPLHHIRIDAIRMLGESGDSKSENALLEIAQTATSAWERFCAANLLTDRKKRHDLMYKDLRGYLQENCDDHSADCPCQLSEQILDLFTFDEQKELLLDSE